MIENDSDRDYQILNEDIEFKLKELSDWIGSSLPPGWGFTILLSSFGSQSDLFYMSNIRRDDLIELLKKFIDLEEKKKHPIDGTDTTSNP